MQKQSLKRAQPDNSAINKAADNEVDSQQSTMTITLHDSSFSCYSFSRVIQQLILIWFVSECEQDNHLPINPTITYHLLHSLLLALHAALQHRKPPVWSTQDQRPCLQTKSERIVATRCEFRNDAWTGKNRKKMWCHKRLDLQENLQIRSSRMTETHQGGSYDAKSLKCNSPNA